MNKKLTGILTIPLLTYALSGDIYADTIKIKTPKGVIEVDESRIKKRQDNTLYSLHFKGKGSISFEEANNIVEKYPFKFVKDYSEKEKIQQMQISITNYSKLEYMILDPNFMLTSQGWTKEHERASQRIYKGKEALVKKNYEIAVKWLKGAIDYMIHTSDNKDIMEKEWPENKSPLNNPIRGILFLQAQYLLAKSYEGLGDKVNAELAYINVLEFPSTGGWNQFTHTIQKRAEEYIKEMNKEN